MAMLALGWIANEGTRGRELGPATVTLYPRFDADLGRFLAEGRHTYSVPQPPKDLMVSRLRTFASEQLGIALGQLETDARGNTFGEVKSLAGDVITSYVQIAPRSATRAASSNEILAARRLVAHVPLSTLPFNVAAIRQEALLAMDQYDLWIDSTLDLANEAPRIYTKTYGANESWYGIATITLVRAFDNRPIVNSKVFIDVSPLNEVIGISLRNWFEVETAAQMFPQKSFYQVKQQIVQKASHLALGQVEITNCDGVFYQMQYELVPAVRCRALLQASSSGEPAREAAFVISLKRGIEINEWRPRSLTEGNTWSGLLPAALEDDSTEDYGVSPTFAVFLQSSMGGGTNNGHIQVERIYAELSTWLTPASDSFLLLDFDYMAGGAGSVSQQYADGVDLLISQGHGAVAHISTDTLANPAHSYVMHTFDDKNQPGAITRFGDRDLEYWIHTGSLTASAISCHDEKDGVGFPLTPIERFTADSSVQWHTAFNGLHHFMGNHGVATNDDTDGEGKMTSLSLYLQRGYPVWAAWYYAELDNNALGHANSIRKYTSVETSCSHSESINIGPNNRWAKYPAGFYLKATKYESMLNRATYRGCDYDDGDAEYELEGFYTYTSATIPVSAEDYPLP